ncbi:MAG TPA: helix-turn-helix transcriptional regulator [Nocardioidaceae bacterium]|nr:helix-turn-helix transcriptional regulator [Nocardioidaceae bacterium]
MEPRQRGNPSGNTNMHVAANLRAARQAIGMDLRTFADKIKETGRAVSASALSKVENGDRRVDVDDLTVFAYILGTTPAALLTPPEGAPTPTGVPEGDYEAEELRAWVRGQTQLTTESLAAYWKDQYFAAVSSLRYHEDLIAKFSKEGADQRFMPVYQEQAAANRARRDAARLRLLTLDPGALPAPRDDAADGWA